MKTLIAAIALTIAVPAAAQTADPHAAHKTAEHEGHEKGQHEGHKMDCCKDADGNGKMDCCEKMKDGEAMAGHEGHQMKH